MSVIPVEAMIRFPVRIAEMNEPARREEEVIEPFRIVRVVRDGRVVRHVRRIVHVTVALFCGKVLCTAPCVKGIALAQTPSLV